MDVNIQAALQGDTILMRDCEFEAYMDANIHAVLLTSLLISMRIYRR